jgi:tetratricopeptide (TPR) repeat protein
MLTLAAWQPPGAKQLSVMTASDFPSLRGYVVTAVESNPAAERKICFDWNVVDDWRQDQDRVALIRMRFRAISERGAEGGSRVGLAPPNATSEEEPVGQAPPYRWIFDDGVVKTGRTVERVFFTPGSHTVKVQVLKGDQVLAETTQTVYAGAVADKMWAEPRDPKAFQRQMAQIDWRKAPIQDVVRLYTIGVELPEPVCKKAAVPVLLDRIGELMAQPQYQPFCLELGQYLTSAPVQQYDRALSLYTSLLEKTKEGTPIRQQTMVLAGEVSLRCLGKPDAALRLLNQARWEKAPDKTWTIRLGQVRAEALLAVGDTKELDAQMQQLRELGTKQDPRRQALRHAGLLEQAAVLARVKDDPVQWDYAMDNLQTILREEPDQVLSPALNRARLDVHLARSECKIVRYLAEYLAKLDQTVYDRAQVLLRQVEALCALGDTDSAKKALDELTRIYPNSDPAAQAKALVVEAVRKPRPQ